VIVTTGAAVSGRIARESRAISGAVWGIVMRRELWRLLRQERRGIFP